MSIRTRMEEAAKRGAARTDTAPIGEFLRRHLHAGGGFVDRAGQSDLYYTVFGLAASAAIGLPLPIGPAQGYLRSFGAGRPLDFVHKCCLARCWAMVGLDVPAEQRDALVSDLEQCRSADGCYDPMPGSHAGSTYASFLAAGAYEDLGQWPHRAGSLAVCVQGHKTPGGGYANDTITAVPLTTATAAAIEVLAAVSGGGQYRDDSAAAWLLSCALPRGGFAVTSGVDEPDLLSTATALHALAAMGRDVGSLAGPTRDFVLGLQASDGGFRGSRHDELSDCEYTFYALLALGHLK